MELKLKVQIALWAALVCFLVSLHYSTATETELYTYYSAPGAPPESWTITLINVPSAITINPPDDWKDPANTPQEARWWDDLWWRLRQRGKMPISRSTRVIVGGEGCLPPDKAGAPTEARDKLYAENPLGFIFRWWPIHKNQKRTATFA